MKQTPFSLVLVLSALSTTAVTHAVEAGGAHDRAVRPFLAKHCIACHGAEVQEADLRLEQPG